MWFLITLSKETNHKLIVSGISFINADNKVWLPQNLDQFKMKTLLFGFPADLDTVSYLLCSCSPVHMAKILIRTESQAGIHIGANQSGAGLYGMALGTHRNITCQHIYSHHMSTWKVLCSRAGCLVISVGSLIVSFCLCHRLRVPGCHQPSKTKIF